MFRGRISVAREFLVRRHTKEERNAVRSMLQNDSFKALYKREGMATTDHTRLQSCT
jgi:hypothetical protein